MDDLGPNVKDSPCATANYASAEAAPLTGGRGAGWEARKEGEEKV